MPQPSPEEVEAKERKEKLETEIEGLQQKKKEYDARKERGGLVVEIILRTVFFPE